MATHDVRSLRSVSRLLVAAHLIAGCVEAGADGREGAASARSSDTATPEVTASTSLSVAVTASAAPSAAQPKRASVAEVLAAIPEDPPPAEIIKGTHYFVSNELSPEAFHKQADGRGGIYLGVGAEQNYLFAGWARPEAIIVADFDQWVVDVHFIHGVLLREAKDPEAFVALWSRGKSDRARKLIGEAYPEKEARERILDIHRITQGGVYEKLLNQQVGYRGRKIPTWLTDQAQYDHVAGLWRRGHVRALRGDFTGKVSLAGIADAARKLELPVRTMYLSNIEDYFFYSSGLGPNLLAQPVDERSIILRTWAVHGTKYMYVAQLATDFHRWLKTPGINHRLDIQSRTGVERTPEGRFLGGPPGTK
jgi:hypothetical protein